MFTIKDALTVGWHKFAQRPWYFIGLFSAFIGLFITVASESAMATALSYALYASFFVLLMRHYAGNTVKFDDMFDQDVPWLSLAFIGIMKGVLIFLGFICFIIPGIYLSVRWMFAELLVIDKKMKPLEALKASSELTKGHRWHLFGFLMLSIAIIFLGLLLLIIGIIPAMIILAFAFIHIYYGLQKQPVPEATTTPTESKDTTSEATV